MLAALIFATEDADDAPGRLAATLPFGATTLIEYQARLLLAAGVTQILVAVARMTPELLGAVGRIGRHATIDVIRSAAEAREKVHPIAHILVMADALVTTDAVLALIGGEGADALLVTGDDDALPGLERVGAAACWAGLARIGARRLTDAAALPDDYDFQSSLLRTTAQAGAEQVRLPPGAARAGIGIERNSAALARRSRLVLAALAGNRVAWIDRLVFAPLIRLTLPMLVARSVSDLAVLAGGALIGLGGCAALLRGWPALGLALVFAALAMLSLGAMLSWLRGEEGHARVQQHGIAGLAAIGLLLTGRTEMLARDGAGTALAVAAAGVAAWALGERAASADTRRRWWGTPPSYVLAVLPFALVGHTLAGLVVSALYATATLAAGIEALREKA